MKKAFATLLLLVSATQSFSQGGGNFKPIVWLKADSFNPSDGYWKDQSGKNNHAKFTGTFVPSSDTVVINFNKAIYFDGIDDSLYVEIDLSKTAQFTVITVFYSQDTTTEDNGVWFTTVGDEKNEMYLTTQRSRGLQGVAKYSTGNMDLPVVNIAGQYWGKKMPQTNLSKLYIGGAPTTGDDALKNFNGFISEFIVFDHLLSEEENQYVQSYLGFKYGSTMMYSNYTTSNDKVVWDFAKDSIYSYSIAAIGREDGFGVNQKQAYSTSEETFLVIGAGNIAPSNDENTYNLKKDNFLVWGCNDKPLALEPDTTETYPNKLPILDRKWKMVTYGNFAKDIPTELNVHASKLLGNPKRCYLVIDRSAQGDFSLPDIEYIQADSISEEGVAYFKNIEWDTDGSGSDLFSFSFGMDSGLEWENPSCFNENSGKIDIRVRGGISPYTYTLKNDSLSYYNQWTSEDRIQEVDSLLYGGYSLFVLDANKDSVLNDFVMLNPDLMTLPLDDEYKLELDGNLVLDATIVGDDFGYISYVWTSNNGFNVNAPKVTISEAGEYEVIASNSKDCIVKKNFTVLPADLLYQYGIYPNPSTGEFFIELNLSSITDVQVRIFNSIGQVVHSFKDGGLSYYKFSHTLSISGLYVIEIVTSDSKEIFKLVVNN